MLVDSCGFLLVLVDVCVLLFVFIVVCRCLLLFVVLRLCSLLYVVVCLGVVVCRLLVFALRCCVWLFVALRSFRDFHCRSYVNICLLRVGVRVVRFVLRFVVCVVSRCLCFLLLLCVV